MWRLLVTRAKRIVMALSLLASSIACSSAPAAPSPVLPIPLPPVGQQALMLSTPRVLAFGDSLTEGADGENVYPPVDPSTSGPSRTYPFKLQALLAARYTKQTISVFNGGVGGKTAAESLPRLTNLITQFTPNVVIILCGVNDLNGGDSVDTATASMARLVSAAQSHGIYVVLSTLPRQREGGRRAYSYSLVQPFNDALRHLAATSGAILGEVYPLITVDLIAPDGLHLTEGGNDALAHAYFDVLKARFEYAQPAVTSRSRR